MNQKHWKNIYHENVNVNWMVRYNIQIKSRIIINAHVTAKYNEISCVWKRLHLKSIIDNSKARCGEIIDLTKTVPINLND